MDRARARVRAIVGSRPWPLREEALLDQIHVARPIFI